MHRTECFVTSAVGGFKINGPPRIGKGPMTSKEVSDTSNEASLPQPTQAGRTRLETCQEIIRRAIECLESNNKDCIIKMLEELVRNQCHNGYAVGKEIADKVRGVVHELWLVSDDECRCELLRMLRDLGISKKWFKRSLKMSPKDWNNWSVKCVIDWENRMVRSNVVKVIEGLLREKFGWDGIRMCEELWRFIGVDVDEFRRHGIEPCIWLNGLESLHELKRPYWLGLARSDLRVEKRNSRIYLMLMTTNTVDGVFFVEILGTVKTPSLKIVWSRAPANKYVDKQIALQYVTTLKHTVWPWPIKPNVDELVKIIEGFNNEELAEFIAGMMDGDGSIGLGGTVYVEISACKACPKRVIDVLKEIIAKRFGIIGSINQLETADVLVFRGEDAIRLLRRIVKYIHHPLRRLRAELILALYNGRISPEEFEKLYEQTEYERGKDDIKRNHALEALAQAAPQTHTNRDLGLALTLYYLHFAQYQSSRRSSFSSVVPTAFITTVNMAV